MFYEEDNICYCRPDSRDGDFIMVGNSEYEVHETVSPPYHEIITGNSGQVYILVD